MRHNLFKLVLVLSLLTGISFSSAFAAKLESKVYRNTPAPEVELYVTSWCPYCEKAKSFFDQRGIEYQLYDIERDAAAAKRKQQLATGKGVPFAIINGTKISGWSQQLYQTALEN